MNSIVKILLILFVCCIFISCEEYTEKPEVLTTEETIFIKNGYTGYTYKKIIIEDHEYYFRSWHTRNGAGSNLVHNPNCSTCKNDTI